MTTTIALVTGANKGIGLATARQLGARGMTVLVGARDAARGREAADKLRAEGADARFVPLEVTDAASVAAAAELVEREHGHLDVLVNNAGIIRADGAGLPSETTLDTLREVYETNVFGVVAVTNALLPLLRRAPAARIVNVSSEVGSIAVMTDPEGALFPLTSIPYPSSKTALNMVTAMYAKELRDTPIKVNAANPGYCATDLNHHSGFRTPEEGAEVSVHLATLPADGPSGLLWGYQMDAGGGYGVLPW
ncbi:SDR family oxidoreductase [Micromonospora sp. AMSO31t]|uniref:SDR family oxidoreductase n=1 Tax=Micromonospora sp. AMSO31t TaxID=2650566 RepID=UPI00124AF5E1|nr:SDR family oxidoreductase [Micromonospora sp. AMSO31t]KAB1904106.1 SDR family oxidoreductase [Micromonospora sp. AMSO31t]